MMQILLKVNPPRFHSVRLERAHDRLMKLPIALAKVGSLLLKEVQRNLSGKVLHKRTGNLYNCFHFQMAVAQYGWRLSIGSTGDVAYDWIHEFGGFTGKNHSTYIPKRSYLWKAYQDRKAAVDRILHKFLQEVFKP